MVFAIFPLPTPAMIVVDFFIFKFKILDFVVFFSCLGLETGIVLNFEQI